MKSCKILFIGILVCVLNLTFSQKSIVYENEYKDYQDAILLCNNKQYKVAEQIFKAAQSSKYNNEEIKENCTYYIANLNLKIGTKNGEQLMLDFVNRFGTSQKKHEAYYNLGEYYFLNNRYKDALVWFKKLETIDSWGNSPDFHFKIGYSYFDQKKYVDAKKHFYRIVKNDVYSDKVKYYLGFIAYESNDYEGAKHYFDDIENNSFIKDKLSYYQSYMYFVLEDYKKAIEAGLQDLKNTQDENQVSQISKIVGESYYKIKEYKASISFLKEYKGEWRNTDYYQLGYAYYKIKNYEEAINYFNKILGKKNRLTQNAYYHLGECYFRIGNKIKALTAFSKASSMDFNQQIQTDSWLNRARLNYEIGDLYQSRVVVLDSFVKKYPDSPYRVEIDNLLADALMLSNNYDDALLVLNNNKFYRNSQAYQRLNYSKGIDLYKEKKYQQAVGYFNKVVFEARDSVYYLKAKYWIADSYFKEGFYSKAILEYEDLQITNKDFDQNKIIQDLDYDIAYCFFKQRAYRQAIKRFKMFLTEYHQAEKKIDATLRLADCYAALGLYRDAIYHYEEAINSKCETIDYLLFRRGMCYGFLGEYEKKISLLQDFVNQYPKSSYVDDAYMTIGDTYKSMEKLNLAIDAYEDLKLKIPYSPLYAQVMMKEAAVFQKQGDDYHAINNYKKVVKDFPQTQESIESVGLAKVIYIKNNDLKSYVSWVKKINFDDSVDYGIEINEFRTAKNRFLRLGKEQNLEAYLLAYPNGVNKNEADFILGNNKVNTNREDDAVIHFDRISLRPPCRFTEGSLYQLAKYFFEREDYIKAMGYLDRLSTTAILPENIIYALLKMAKIKYLSEQYEEAEQDIQKALSEIKDDKYEEEVSLILAQIYMKTKRFEEARGYLDKLIKCEISEFASQAYFEKSYDQFINKNYKESSETIITLTKKYSDYREICGKAMLLLAENYIALEDKFQAVFTLETLVNNYSDYQYLLDRAEKRLNEINDE